MNKVLEFPKSKIVREAPIDIEEITQAKMKGKINFAEGLVEDIANNLVVELEHYGLDMESGDYDKEFCFCVDALRATIYKMLGIEHHLHDFIENNVTLKKLAEIQEDNTEEK